LYHCWWARRGLLCSPYEFSDILRKIILLKRYIALEQRALSFTQNCCAGSELVGTLPLCPPYVPPLWVCY
ncbi:MAG: hypothetical protein Q8R24_10895, partial [Legionellaceae bacterium]|nr:hypothetical protein [Legionellaceae bacterium]